MERMIRDISVSMTRSPSLANSYYHLVPVEQIRDISPATQSNLKTETFRQKGTCAVGPRERRAERGSRSRERPHTALTLAIKRALVSLA